MALMDLPSAVPPRGPSSFSLRKEGKWVCSPLPAAACCRVLQKCGWNLVGQKRTSSTKSKKEGPQDSKTVKGGGCQSPQRLAAHKSVLLIPCRQAQRTRHAKQKLQEAKPFVCVCGGGGWGGRLTRKLHNATQHMQRFAFHLISRDVSWRLRIAAPAG